MLKLKFAEYKINWKFYKKNKQINKNIQKIKNI